MMRKILRKFIFKKKLFEMKKICKKDQNLSILKNNLKNLYFKNKIKKLKN